MPALSDALLLTADRQNGLLTRCQLLAASWTPRMIQYEMRRWRTPLPGVYLIDERQVDLEVRARAALLRWPGVAISHDTAGRLRGWDVLDSLPAWPGLLRATTWDGAATVHVTGPQRPRPRKGYAFHRTENESGAWKPVNVRWLTLTSDARTAFDIARTAPLPVSVALLDSLARARPELFAEIDQIDSAAHGWRGVTAARRALKFTDAKAESPLESIARVLFALARLPPPTTQLRIRLGSQWIRADFGYPEAKLLIEVDGRDYHSDWSAVTGHMARQNALVNAGWRVLRFTWAQILFQPDWVIATICAALAS